MTMDERKDAYENQLIGAFIFAMGYVAGQRGYKNMVLNLHQQTPLDSIYGDLFAGDAKCVAIEFKRRFTNWREEQDKWDHAAAADFVEGYLPRNLSMRGHLFAYGESKSGHHQGLWVSMFEEAVFGCGAEAQRDSVAGIPKAARHDRQVQEQPFQTLINDLLPEPGEPGNVHFGVSPEELRTYLRKLSQFRQSEENAGTSDRWLAVAVSSDGVQMLRADSLDLLMDLLDDPHAPASQPSAAPSPVPSGPRP
jgi:hypothetical protein